MSSSMDPSKLKVVDLRNELTARGLDSKGNKAVLVKRLQDALDEEAAKGSSPSTAKPTDETQHEQEAKAEVVEEHKQPELRRERRRSRQRSIEASKPETPKPVSKNVRAAPIPEEKSEPKSSEKQETKPSSPTKTPVKSEAHSPQKSKQESSVESEVIGKTEELIKKEAESPIKKESPVKQEKSVKTEQQESEQISVKDEKTASQNGEPEEEETGEHEAMEAEEQTEEEAEHSEEAKDSTVMEEDSPVKEESGKKRKRSSSPNRRSVSPEEATPRRRSRSPMRENEPPIDSEKVLLSWYDSDLHLRIDKDNFLSAKPISEGAFGYVWSAARTSHGVSSGKVCYEVKVTEELSCEDFVKFEQRDRSKIYRADLRHKERERKIEKKRKSKTDETTKTDDKSDKEEKEKGNQETENDNQETENDTDKIEKESDENATQDTENVVQTKAEDIETTSSENIDKPTETSMEVSEENTDKNNESMDITEKDEDNVTVLINETESKTELKTGDESKSEEAKPKPIPIPKYCMRIGWSVVNSKLQLGEEPLSYGYDSTGKFVTDKIFVDYGKTYGLNDVVGAYLDIQDEQVVIRYTVNGELQPVATEILKSNLPEDFALFPHVMTRNYAFEINLGDREEPWFPTPAELEGYTFLSKTEEKVSGPPRPEARSDCEVVMMCGLPAVGKTTWVKEHVAANPDKMYNVIGNNSLLERMTVFGQPLKPNFTARWSLLVDKLQKSLNKLTWMAAQRRRNYIIDQTNVFPSAQRRKVRPFEGFHRRAVVVIVDDEEYANRLALQEERDGKDVPESTILEMKAAMAVPEKCDWLEEVTFIGMSEEEAKEKVKKYNTEGKEAGYGLEKRFKSSRYGRHPRDNRGGPRRYSNYQGKRFDRHTPSRYHGDAWGRDRYRSPPRRNYRNDDYRDRSRRYSLPQNAGRSYGRSQPNYRESHGDPRSGNRSVWSGGSHWAQGGHGGGWNQQTFGSGGNAYGGQNWGGPGGQKWGYQGQGYGGYGQNWNYYGQYGQSNWNQK